MYWNCDIFYREGYYSEFPCEWIFKWNDLIFSCVEHWSLYLNSRVNHALQSAEYGSCTWSMNNFSKTIIVYARIIAICKAPVELRGSIVTTHAIEMHLKWLYSHKISLFCRMTRNMMGAGIKLLVLTSLQFWHEWPEVYKWKTYWTERLFVYS